MSSQNGNSGSTAASSTAGSTASSTASSKPIVRDYTNLGASDSASATSSDPPDNSQDAAADSGPIIRNYTGGADKAAASKKPTKSRKAELAEQAKYATPAEMVKNIPKGQLVNPFDPHDKKIAKEGHDLFMNHGCSGCHGGDGGGGMCPPLIDSIWSYGHKPDTLFRLVTLGSKKLQSTYGLTRNAMQTMKADMPPMGPSFKHSKDLWKIITWVESKHLTSGS
ncbi:MAG: c-type cytochrome [Sinobacteraceae bacterium]|nr:c-type cytochrome [Nevskiaceae bacterium]